MRSYRIFLTGMILWLVTIPTANVIAAGPDDAHNTRAREVIAKAIIYLRAQQDEATGGWNVNADGPDLPGVSAMVMRGLLMEQNILENDPTIARGLDYLLSFRQKDGGIYDQILPNYNTSLVLSALSLTSRDDAQAAIPLAQAYLRQLQWSGQNDPHGNPIDEAHPFWGGAGYGQHSRPDNSNLNIMLEALYDSGVDCNDDSFKRAVAFLERTQMLDDVNDMPYADGSRQGGFIYATSTNRDHLGEGESKAGTIEETLDDGTIISRLRCYGSMTYAGFKSYIYANLDRDDVRVTAAHNWIRQHYTLDENPGIGRQGYYYYLATFSRALDAWGEDTIITLNADGTDGEPHQWANELIDTLAELQRADGSFVNEADRWMEGDPVLVTAYALLALQHAIN